MTGTGDDAAELAEACPCGHPRNGMWACLNGRIYGPCEAPECYGACTDVFGPCQSLPGCCDQEKP